GLMATKEAAVAAAKESTKTKKVAGNGGNGEYTADDIKVLEGMEAVRLRPAMYIGSNGEMGLHHLVYEVVDNSVDEALAGHATKVHFLPDKEIFTATEYNFDTLSQRLRELAFLNKGLEITLTDERATDAKTGEAKRNDFKYSGGIAEFIKHLNRGKAVLHEK